MMCATNNGGLVQWLEQGHGKSQTRFRLPHSPP